MAKVNNAAKAALGKIGSIDAPLTGATFADDKSLDFDGTDDKVVISTGFTFINENVSISWWCTRTSTTNNETIFHALNDPSSDQWYKGFHMATKANNGWQWSFGDQVGGTWWSNNSGDIGFNSGDGWHHFVLTIGAGPSTRFVSAPVVLYMDGSSVGSFTSGDASAESAGPIGSDGETLKLQIGHRYDTTYQPYTGNVNDLAIFDTVLDADAVAAMYNSGDPTDLRVNSGDYDNSSNLTGYWWMGDEDTYPTIEDRSGNGNDGTMTNMASGDIETDVPS